MKKLKIANFDHPVAESYRLLTDIKGVDYQECGLLQSSAILHEGEVDVALIPAAEYAAHGRYTSLGFGLSFQVQSRLLMLYAKQPLKRLHTIYTHANGGVGLLLLRLLLSERWRINPRIIRLRENMQAADLGENEGLLVLHNEPVDSSKCEWEVCKDLVSVWHEWTGLPFVFLVWAARPETLSTEQCRVLNEHLYRCHRQHVANHTESKVVPDIGVANKSELCFQYYLEQDMIEGLNLFFHLCAKKGFIPEAQYKSTTISLFASQSPRPIKEKTIVELLDGVIAGKRLGINQGVRLAEESDLGDLAMASEVIRRRLFSETTMSFMFEIKESELAQVSSAQALVDEALDAGCHSLFIVPDNGSKCRDIEFYEEYLYAIRSRYGIPVEGIGIPRMIELANASGCRVEEVVQRLYTAGLDVVPSWGGEILLDEKRSKKEAERFTSSDWIDCVQALHVLGLKSSAAMRMDSRDTWEDRLVHLNKIRSQQDLTAGFWFFCPGGATVQKRHSLTVEDQMRCVMISRLFLDNVPSIQEVRITIDSLPRVLSLCCGANAVRMKIAGIRGKRLRDMMRMLKSVARYEFSFRSDPIEEMIAPNVH